MAVAETLHTDRLALEPWSDAHLPVFAALARTPAVMRFIGDGSTWSDARIHEVHARCLAHWADHGFGWRMAVLGERQIGLIALNFAGEGSGVDADEYEIGWWLSPDHWRQGLTSEGARAIRDEAFGRVGAPSLIARILPGNDASLGVARGLGLAVEGESTGRGGERILVLRVRAPARPAGN